MDIQGRPLEVRTTEGQQHESTIAVDLLDHIDGESCIADGGYDSDQIVNEAKARDLNVVIPPNKSRKSRRRYDKHLYRKRYIVECFFHSLKRYRRIATRFEKTATAYTGFVHLACALMWLI